MSDLLMHEQKFAYMTGKLIMWAYASGYSLTFGEAYRTPEQSALNAKKGTGIKNSLHTQKLAVDFNAFRGDQFLTKVSEYEPLGVYWESLGGTWGGRFLNGKGEPDPDSDHFSLAFGGIK